MTGQIEPQYSQGSKGPDKRGGSGPDLGGLTQSADSAGSLEGVPALVRDADSAPASIGPVLVDEQGGPAQQTVRATSPAALPNSLASYLSRIQRVAMGSLPESKITQEIDLSNSSEEATRGNHAVSPSLAADAGAPSVGGISVAGAGGRGGHGSGVQATAGPALDKATEGPEPKLDLQITSRLRGPVAPFGSAAAGLMGSMANLGQMPTILALGNVTRLSHSRQDATKDLPDWEGGKVSRSLGKHGHSWLEPSEPSRNAERQE